MADGLDIDAFEANLSELAWRCDITGRLAFIAGVETQAAALRERALTTDRLDQLFSRDDPEAAPLFAALANKSAVRDLSLWSQDRRFRFRVSMTPFDRPDRGEHFLGTFSDITDYVQQSHELAELLDQHDLLHRAVQASPVSITIADATAPDLPLTFVNAAFLQTSGYDQDDVIGRNCRFLQGPETDPRATERIRRAVSRQAPIDVELVNHKKSGEAFYNHLSLCPVFTANGQLRAYLGVQRDTTRQRLAERHEHNRERLEALGRLAGGVAHEFNNLLQPALIFPDLIADALPADADAEREYLAIIKDSMQTARSIVLDILTFARGEELKTGPQVPLGPALVNIQRLLRGIMPPSIQIENHLGPDCADLSLPIVEESLKKIMINLCMNAAQAMNNVGTITIRCDKQAHRTTILVRDHGPGIPEEHRSRIFDPFFTTKPIGSGTGLGLAIVNSIVTTAGGTLDVLETGPQGTTMAVNLWSELTADEEEI